MNYFAVVSLQFKVGFVSSNIIYIIQLADPSDVARPRVIDSNLFKNESGARVSDSFGTVYRACS